MQLFYILFFVFLGYLGFSVLSLAISAIAGCMGRADDEHLKTSPTTFRKIGVLIPAYKEDAVIVDSVQVNLKQKYPSDQYDLIVIADSLHSSTLAQLRAMPIKVIEVSFEVSTVTKAINAALAAIPDEKYDIMLVSDADNHMAPDFLSRINLGFEQGWKAIQGHRVGKNTNTSVALLDAISEEVNNHIFRKGSRVLGLSSSIIGSGMAFDASLMKMAMTDLQTMGGYDKELEMNIILSGQKIAYFEDALIYDEKVASRAVFQNQRTRWIAAQWQFVKFYLPQGWTQLLQGHWAAGLKIVQSLVLPRVLLLGLLAICTCIGLVSSAPELWIAPFSLLMTLVVTLLISVPAYLRRRITLREVLLVPALMLNFAKAVFNMRKAFKSFLHTPHQGTPDAPTSR